MRTEFGTLRMRDLFIGFAPIYKNRKLKTKNSGGSGMDMATNIDGPDGFVSSSATMQAYASRTTQLLSAIEQAVRSITADTEMLSIFAREAHKTLELLRTVKRDDPIDPSGRISELLRAGAAAALRIHNDAVKRHAAAVSDKQLRDEDGVADSYAQFIEAAATVHDLLEDIRDTVECNDASLEPSTGKTFTSVDELIADILK